MRSTVIAWLKDTTERVFWTFVQGSTAILTVDQFGWVDFGDMNIWKAAVAGGAAAVFSLIKAAASSRIGAKGTAQLGTKTYAYEESGPGSAGGDL
jgi:hypothetical protein